MVDKSNLQNERELIYLLLHRRDALDSFYDCSLAVANFSEENQPIVFSILESYDIDGVLLTRKSFKDKIRKYRSPKDRIAHELAFNSCYAAKSSMNDFPLLVNKIIEQNVKESITKSLEVFTVNSSSKGDIPAIKQLINDCEKILDSVITSGEKAYFEDIRVLSKERVQYLKDVVAGKIKEDPIILSGIREIDYAMMTGFEKGTLTLICADVGAYKSSMMLNIALNVWKNKFDVLFVPLEMHRDQMWRRACAREARVRSEIITRNIKGLKPEEIEKIDKMNGTWDSYPSKFYMMEEPGNTTVTKIQRQIENHINIIKPKLVVIDYVANLEAHKNRYGRNDLEIGDMLKTMRQMGKDLNFAVLSAAQLGREALKRIRNLGANRDKATINSEDIRGSHEYAADADNIFAQLKSTSQPNELLDLFCVKSRNGPTVFEGGSVRATLDIHPQFGLISSPPIYNSEGVEQGDSSACSEELENLMDKSETDEVISKGKAFKEEDDMYNYNDDSYGSDGNEDIENSIDDVGGELEEWDEDF